MDRDLIRALDSIDHRLGQLRWLVVLLVIAQIVGDCGVFLK